MSAGKSRIREKGTVSVNIVTYTFVSIFIAISLFPLFWMFSSSMKDSLSVYKFPPDWLPKVPKTIEVVIDYDGTDVVTRDQFELEAMKVIWYTWKNLQNEPIGALEVTGVQNDHIVYEASMPSYKFTIGRNEIVPTNIFKETTMRNKLPKIQEKKLTAFSWVDQSAAFKQNAEASFTDGNASSLPVLSAKVASQITDSQHIKGKMIELSEQADPRRLFDNYISLWKMAGAGSENVGFPSYFLNSVIVTAASIIAQLVIGGLAGYALSFLVSKKTATWLTLFFVATIMIPEIAILVPLYLTMMKLNLVDTLWGIILPHTAWGIVIFLFRGFFSQLPSDLIQAARIDGASEIRIFGRIIVPLSIPIFTVVSVMCFIAVWNEFLWPLVVARSPDVWTFTVALNDFQNRPNLGANVMMASLVISTLPFMFIMISCQKLIEKGASFTGVKA